MFNRLKNEYWFIKNRCIKSFSNGFKINNKYSDYKSGPISVGMFWHIVQHETEVLL